MFTAGLVAPVAWNRAPLQTLHRCRADPLSIWQLGCKNELTTGTDRFHPSPLVFVITNTASSEPRMSRFMYDYRSDHLRRLGQDEAGVELTSGDRRTEGSGGTGQRHYLDAFEIA